MVRDTVLVWFRRDLRLADQAAFHHATREARRVVPLFILDPSLLAPPHMGGPRLHFLLDCLTGLDANLRKRGSSLVVRRGEPVAVLRQVLKESNAGSLYVNREYLPSGRARDERVTVALREDGVDVRSFADLLLVEPDQLLTRQGKPYRVYTPYRRAWLRTPKPEPFPNPPERLAPHGLATLPIPTAEGLGVRAPAGVAKGGEDAGLALLRAFTQGMDAPIRRYKTQRNFPAIHGTSHLSPHLRFGAVGIRTVLAAGHAVQAPHGEGDRDGAEAWMSELAWREFYYQWVWHAPYVLRHAFDPRLDALPWESEGDRFAAWSEGRTGFPIIDAAMRQLNATGWMNNRLRMVTASFLCKDLLLDWRLGERYFWEHLTCGDKPANVGGWQWSASLGIDPQPYFRIFNPRAQGERFDPDGTFTRRWVPELTALPTRYIHAPHSLGSLEAQRFGFVLDRDYPSPIVDHDSQRKRALDIYGRLKKL